MVDGFKSLANNDRELKVENKVVPGSLVDTTWAFSNKRGAQCLDSREAPISEASSSNRLADIPCDFSETAFQSK